jgi:ribosomal protein L20A (L18A)
MKAFRVDGELEVSRRNWQKFSKEIAAEDEEKAKEKIFCDLGSRHGLARRAIKIRKVKELKSDEIIDATVRHQIGAD